VAQPYSRFLQLLDQGEVQEALIGADRIQFAVREGASLTADERKAITGNQPLAARWAGAQPERRFEDTRLPGVDDDTLPGELIGKDAISEQDIKVRFNDVAGIEEAKAELQETGVAEQSRA
jgi:hypothetical protein